MQAGQQDHLQSATIGLLPYLLCLSSPIASSPPSMLLLVTRVHGSVLNALADNNGAGEGIHRNLIYSQNWNQSILYLKLVLRKKASIQGRGTTVLRVILEIQKYNRRDIVNNIGIRDCTNSTSSTSVLEMHSLPMIDQPYA